MVARRFFISLAFAFRKLGLPTLGNDSVPERLKFQHKIYKWFALPTVLYAGMVFFAAKNFKQHAHHLVEDQKKTGLRPQL